MKSYLCPTCGWSLSHQLWCISAEKPCPSCAEKDARIGELKTESGIAQRGWERTLDMNKELQSKLSASEEKRWELEEEARQVCGMLGEFYGKGQKTAVEKIRFYQNDYEEQLQSFRENIDTITRGAEERDEVWREKKRILENDLGAAWKKIAALEKVVEAVRNEMDADWDMPESVRAALDALKEDG